MHSVQGPWERIDDPESRPICRTTDRAGRMPSLKSQRELLAPNRYRDLKVRSQPAVRSTILGCLVEIEKAAAAAIAGTAPNPLLWGTLTAASFLIILEDVTTWALTHFESVRSWSVAEDFTPTEEQEGYGLIGRGQRISASDYRADRLTRSLRTIPNPKVRGGRALDSARTVGDVSHGRIGPLIRTNPQDRQSAVLAGAAPASRQWLAQRQAKWPPRISPLAVDRCQGNGLNRTARMKLDINC